MNKRSLLSLIGLLPIIPIIGVNATRPIKPLEGDLFVRFQPYRDNESFFERLVQTSYDPEKQTMKEFKAHWSQHYSEAVMQSRGHWHYAKVNRELDLVAYSWAYEKEPDRNDGFQSGWYEGDAKYIKPPKWMPYTKQPAQMV